MMAVDTLAIVGMASERAILGDRPGVRVIVGAGNAPALASQIEAGIATGAKAIISLGVCGALSPQLQVGELVIGVSVCASAVDKLTTAPGNLTSSDPLVDNGAIIHSDKDWSRRIFRALTDGPKPVTFPVSFGNVVSTIAPVATEAQRAALHASTGAHVVDMESFIAASAAKAHGLPLAIVRVVLDRFNFNLPLAAQIPLKPDGSPNLFAILRSLFGDLSQGAGLIQLAGWSETAMGNLAVALAAIGDRLGAIQ